MTSTSDVSYWTRLSTLSTNRRHLLRMAAVGSGLLGSALAACGRDQTSSGKSASTGAGASAAAAGRAPESGGTFSTYFIANYPLDPQKASASPQQTVGGAYSRLFRLKTGPNPNDFIDHDIENDLAISAESPDATTWTIKLRTNAKFHNIPPVNGHAVEADDIKATLNSGSRPSHLQPESRSVRHDRLKSN